MLRNQELVRQPFILGHMTEYFLGYKNTMHNICYWDIHTGKVKTATHDSKDEIQYGDHPSNRSPALKHLMEVFTGSSDHTTNTEPTPVELKLKNIKDTSADDIIKNTLDSTSLPYTQAAAAKISTQNDASINNFLIENDQPEHQDKNQDKLLNNSSSVNNFTNTVNFTNIKNIIIKDLMNEVPNFENEENSKINQSINKVSNFKINAVTKIDPPGYKDDNNNNNDNNTNITVSEEVNNNSFEHPLKPIIASSLASDTSLNHRQKEQIQRRVNKFVSKSKFTRPDVSQLKHELDAIDISTDLFLRTISETIPINKKIFHLTLGMVTAKHPDIKDTIELVEFQPGTSCHRHITAWKRRLKGIIIATIDGQKVSKPTDISRIVDEAQKSGK